MKKILIGLMAASLVLGTISCKSEKERRIKKYGALERAKTSEENYAESIYNTASTENGSYDPISKLVFPIDLSSTSSYGPTKKIDVARKRVLVLKSFINDTQGYYTQGRIDSAKIFLPKYEKLVTEMDSLEVAGYRYNLNWFTMPSDDINDADYDNLGIYLTVDKKYICLDQYTKVDDVPKTFYYRKESLEYQGEKSSLYRSWMIK